MSDAPPPAGGWRQPPSRAILAWVADVLGETTVETVRGMCEWGSPWLLRTGRAEVVLRVGAVGDADRFAREIAGIDRACAAGVPVPAVLGHDDGAAEGLPLLLFERLLGTSAIPVAPDRDRLRRLGGVSARIHGVDEEPSGLLPPMARPMSGFDFVSMRQDGEEGALQRLADERLAALRPTDERAVLVHGDLWHGNTLWDGDNLSGLVDWEWAGIGAPGIDLGSLRCDAALSYGVGAGDEILAGWEEVAGEPAPDVAYWDVVAALASPPDMAAFVTAIRDQGRPDLDQPTLFARREAFLSDALERLARKR